jgi:hypothetical protein
MKYILSLLISVVVILTVRAQNLPVNDRFIHGFWDARWIAPEQAEPMAYGVYHFRKSFDLKSVPDQFIIHVSADNRYRLYVNGIEVSLGPARGDLQHWRFETVDIAASLQPGNNTLAAVVWNFAEYAPVAQIWHRTGFILQGDSDSEAVVNTNNTWKVIRNEAYRPERKSQAALHSYLVVGPGDMVVGSLYPWGWNTSDFNDSQWPQASSIALGKGLGKGTDGDWLLVPRKIPPMMSYQLKPMNIVRSHGIEMDNKFLTGTGTVNIPANSKVSILLDQTHLTNGYPMLKVTGGKTAKIKLSYSEALFDEKNNKGNRNQTAGKEMKGMADIFIADGGRDRIFSPLWFRTWRFVQLDIETRDEPLILNSLTAYYTGYPLAEKAYFVTDQGWTEQVWEVGWRTAELCAGENYFDCPYYEQLQYVGDTRIQALISLYVAGDDRLVRKAIDDFEQSRVWNGLTQSRYPSQKMQLIPPYSLFWIAMVHDYWQHRPDLAYVKDKLPVVRSVLEWYEQQVNEQGMLGRMPWWHFVDWTDEWAWNDTDRIGGVPSQDEQGNSSVLTSQYIYALQYAEELHSAFGFNYQAANYRDQRQKLLQSFNELCWDAGPGLYSDSPGAKVYSQHANIFAILIDALPEEEQKELMVKIMADDHLIQATFYFKFYLFRALVKTGMADRYLEQLKPWRDMLDLGLTTFAEKPDPTRSDCHAWSASPNYDFLAIVAGIMPDSPGFKTVKITPALGGLKSVTAAMPHPQGELKIDYVRKKKSLSAVIDLPGQLSGTLVWQGKEYALHPGRNELKAK